MTTFAPTQIADGNATRFTIGSACKVAASVAVVGAISLFSIAQMSGAPLAPSTAAILTHQSELRGLLCRIDHRCPTTTELAAREASKTSSGAPFVPAATMKLTRQSELRNLLCRIDHRCPTASDLAVREASNARTAENIGR